MKRSILTVTAFALLFFGLAIVSASAQQVVGNYRPVNAKSAEVRQAAKFAVTSQSRESKRKYAVVRILHAEQQVVAGTNFRLCMRVRDERGHRSTITAIVYRNLKKRRSLTSWESGRCQS